MSISRRRRRRCSCSGGGGGGFVRRRRLHRARPSAPCLHQVEVAGCRSTCSGGIGREGRGCTVTISSRCYCPLRISAGQQLKE
ncbi:hypothetical protein BDA96_01G577300 [Sorghum bicolor]|uniref:Uncharacterized protein n=1 Tax=Sorghum bicolor TaxID=4558 RepID=A0A921V3C7_SORBI|nr:hypothetical protein BDA96_01G577300 [Sorghum bicolor]